MFVKMSPNCKILSDFFQVFPKVRKPRFWGRMPLLRERGGRATKMNITFFIGNKILNIFSFNNVFKKSEIFQNNRGKSFLGGHDHFWWKRVLDYKNEKGVRQQK